MFVRIIAMKRVNEWGLKIIVDSDLMVLWFTLSQSTGSLHLNIFMLE